MPRTPAELAARLDATLDRAGRLVALVPSPYLEHRPRPTGPSAREVAYAIFRGALAFADGMDLGRAPADWLAEEPPPDLGDGGAIARYGALVRGRVGGWFDGAGASEYARVIEGPDGPITGQEWLERIVARTGAALVELHAMVDDLGLAPGDPLPPDLAKPPRDPRA